MQLRVLVTIALVLAVVFGVTLIIIPLIPAEIAGPGKFLSEVAFLTMLATPAVFFALLRPHVIARTAAEREFARLTRELEAEIAAHREAEEILRNREEALRQHANEIEYNQSFMETHAAEMVALAEQIAAQKNDVEESKRLSDYTANHDILTGLPNRRNFQNRLAEIISAAENQGGGAGLIYIDLDKFKSVNDRMGHERGDKLLQEVADRLRASLSPGHVAARLGGDEFAVIASAPLCNEDMLKNLAAIISAALKIDVETPEGLICVGASLGVAQFPENGLNATDILRHADQAMYAAKADTVSRVVFYSDLARVSPESEQDRKSA